MSKQPIFNDITVYATYMNPSTFELETRLPHPLGAFKDLSQPMIIKSKHSFGYQVDLRDYKSKNKSF